jgi:hypothetical protein
MPSVQERQTLFTRPCGLLVSSGSPCSVSRSCCRGHLPCLTCIASTIAVLSAFSGALFFAWAFGRGARAYAEINRKAQIDDDIPAKEAFFKKSWHYFRLAPCCPTFVPAFGWFYVWYKIMRMKYVIGDALWVAVAALVINLLWLAVRSTRVFRAFKWTKREPAQD